MTNKELLIKNLTSKDEKTAIQAATEIINNCDIDAFKLLCQKSDFLFDFVKEILFFVGHFSLFLL